MSADATTLLTALLSARPSGVTTASSDAKLQQVLLGRMGVLLQQTQAQLKKGKGQNMKVDVDMMREFVRNASLLSSHLMAIQQSNIDCKQVHELFAEQADMNKMCNILLTSDKQRKCKVVDDKCLPVQEAQAGEVAKVQKLLGQLADVKRTEARAYGELVHTVLQDLHDKTTDKCHARCAMMITNFARTVNNAFQFFQQQSVIPMDSVIQQITAQLSSGAPSNLGATIQLLKQAVQQYKAAAQQARKTLEDQQKVFNAEYAKLGVA